MLIYDLYLDRMPMLRDNLLLFSPSSKSCLKQCRYSIDKEDSTYNLTFPNVIVPNANAGCDNERNRHTATKQQQVMLWETGGQQ